MILDDQIGLEIGVGHVDGQDSADGCQFGGEDVALLTHFVVDDLGYDALDSLLMGVAVRTGGDEYACDYC